MKQHLQTLIGWMGIALFIVSSLGCQGTTSRTKASDDVSDRTINIVATTSMVADLVKAIGQDRTEVTGLMGPGVDPHLYKASEGDVVRMAEADAIFYNGLHLEGKMTEVFEQMTRRDIPTYPVAQNSIPDSLLLASLTYTGNYDPHVWFDVLLWMQVAQEVQEVLATMDPQHAAFYKANATAYLAELEALDAYVREQAARVPTERRVLITSHDAFGYFGEAYGFEVRGLQGLSTASEAGTADVQQLAAFVAERQIPAVFVESSVSSRGIEAVQAAVRARGFNVTIGGNLFSDALGNPDTPEGTYIGTVRFNIDTIVAALLGQNPV